MKKMYLLLLSLFFIFSVNQSCSSDEGGGGSPSVTSITISANQNSVIVGESIDFTVRTNTGQDVTSSADIKIDNNSISGNSYSASAAGSYTAKASYNGLTSNSITVNFVAGNFNSIVLTVSPSEVVVGESVTFTATGDTGGDLTNQATFSVNGNSITGNTYTTATAGNHFVRARVGNISSNQESFMVINPPATAIYVVPSIPCPAFGNDVMLTVEDNFGADVTAQSTLFVDGAEWDSSTPISSDEAASFEVYATMEDLTSETEEIEFREGIDNFVKNVLIEDYTGTWCGWCPRVNRAIEIVEEATEHAIAVGLHDGDEMSQVNVNALKDLINLQGYPTAKLDRMTDWASPENENTQQALDIAGNESDLGLSIETSISGNSVTAVVKVMSVTPIENKELVVYLVEDGLAYNQANNYTDLYGGQNPIPGFIHNGVLRDVYTDLLGDEIPTTCAGEEYSVSFTETLPSYVQDSENVSIVAFVIDATTNDTINAQHAKVGEDQAYQFHD